MTSSEDMDIDSAAFCRWPSNFAQESSESFTCDHPGCTKKFSAHNALVRHSKTHSDGAKGFKCKVCNKEFVQKSSLARHVQIHLDDKPHQCRHENCGKRFKLREYLDAHTKTHISLDRPTEVELQDNFEKEESTARLLA